MRVVLSGENHPHPNPLPLRERVIYGKSFISVLLAGCFFYFGRTPTLNQFSSK